MIHIHSGSTSTARTGGLKAGTSVLVVALMTLPVVAQAQEAQSSTQSTPTPQAAKRTAPSDRAAAAAGRVINATTRT
ncbi:MAG: hypothetical protein EOP67_77445, partial [Sphingomonas sp.]